MTLLDIPNIQVNASYPNNQSWSGYEGFLIGRLFGIALQKADTVTADSIRSAIFSSQRFDLVCIINASF